MCLLNTDVCDSILTGKASGSKDCTNKRPTAAVGGTLVRSDNTVDDPNGRISDTRDALSSDKLLSNRAVCAIENDTDGHVIAALLIGAGHLFWVSSITSRIDKPGSMSGTRVSREDVTSRPTLVWYSSSGTRLGRGMSHCLVVEVVSPMYERRVSEPY